MSLFFVTFSTLFRHIPEPVQNNALSFGWSLFVVIVPIDLARLNATYSVPGFSSSVVKSPGSTINCLNWSFMSKQASKPLNLWMVVAQAGTRGQYVTLHHDCFRLQNLVIIVMGTCCTSLERFSVSKMIWKLITKNHTYLDIVHIWKIPKWKIPGTKFPSAVKGIFQNLENSHHQRTNTTKMSRQSYGKFPAPNLVGHEQTPHDVRVADTHKTA